MTKKLGLKLCICLVAILLTLGAVFLVKGNMSRDVARILPFEVTHWPYPIDFSEHIYVHNVEFIGYRQEITYTVTNASSDFYYVRHIRMGFKLIDNEWFLMPITAFEDLSSLLVPVPRYDSIEWSFNLHRLGNFNLDVDIHPLPDGIYKFVKPLYTWPWPHMPDGSRYEFTWLPLIVEITSGSS